jgi:hypothetical protein
MLEQFVQGLFMAGFPAQPGLHVHPEIVVLAARICMQSYVYVHFVYVHLYDV